MTTATKEKTYAQMTLEDIPEALKDTSIPRLIDDGLSGLGDYSNFTALVDDEEFAKKMEEYELQEGNVKSLTKGLPEVIREDIKNSLEEMESIAYMNRHEGAEKMADVLIRFYVKHHLGLDV